MGGEGTCGFFPYRGNLDVGFGKHWGHRPSMAWAVILAMEGASVALCLWKVEVSRAPVAPHWPCTSLLSPGLQPHAPVVNLSLAHRMCSLINGWFPAKPCFEAWPRR